MSAPVIAFFNNKGGLGKTSLVYHLAWMMAEKRLRVVAADLDPQANLTANFLSEDRLSDRTLHEVGQPPRRSVTHDPRPDQALHASPRLRAMIDNHHAQGWRRRSGSSRSAPVALRIRTIMVADGTTLPAM
jgi:cellulose biosynthesis protein BcsQ